MPKRELPKQAQAQGLDLLAEAARLMEKFGNELADTSSTRFIIRIPLLQ